jgi:hypothetical protein
MGHPQSRHYFMYGPPASPAYSLRETPYHVVTLAIYVELGMPETNDYLVLNGKKVSPETLKSLATPPFKKRRRPLWLRLMSRHPIWTYLIVVGGAGIILSHYWRIVERIAPPLNEFIHREVSDKNDADYQLYKLRRSQQRYIAETASCDEPEAEFATCRLAIVTSKPELADMESRISKLQSGWRNEVATKPMPQECRDLGTSHYDELAKYVENDRRISDVIEAADPTSEASVAKAKEELNRLGPAEEQATVRIKTLPKWSEECAKF